MNDNDIIKALECCSRDGLLNCRNCPYEESCNMGKSDMQKDALNLINRQKEEIERLQKENNQFADIGKLYSEIKSKAITDFAERLTKICDAPYWCVWLSEIEDLLEEMVGEGK